MYLYPALWNPDVTENSTCGGADAGPVATHSVVRGSVVVKVTDSWLACHKFEPNTTEDPPCSGAMHVKSRDLKRPPVGVVWKLGEGASLGVVLVT
ncbi:hypothetical protein TNCV_1109461 [Trichonephila clavipes]|nr:hypothetical protein TNCV_1109461 [Trichonephila clavipes]